MNLDLQQNPHRRFNPLTREWVLVSPHRAARPWQGRIETTTPISPHYDPNCYLCPGNARAGGVHNPDYKSTFAFDNDFAALRPTAHDHARNDSATQLFIAEPETGICRVLCFSPRHDLTLAQMSEPDILEVVDTWTKEHTWLSTRPGVTYVQIFENRGELMGCSNPHPHCQIWASSSVPNQPAKEGISLAEYRKKNNTCLLCDYLVREQAAGERIVCENQHFLSVVPFWAVWPFETLLLSKRHLPDLTTLSSEERTALANILKQLTTRYDNLFEVSFPYSMGFHQSPADGQPHDEQHFHAHYYPPLLRSATVKKFMVGYELLASPQRDITAESAAERLRALPAVHFSERQ
jgi:UDPglucose--hexose-1-phosphate uridylyltransferase